MTLGIAAALALPQAASGYDETGRGQSSAGAGGEASPQSFFMGTLQCLKDKLKNSARATPTMEAFGKAYELIESSSSDKAQRVKKPTRLELEHLLAQILIETGYLESLTEKGKEHEQFSGRGFIQITGKDNYKNCAEFLRAVGGPFSTFAHHVESGGSNADSVIGNRAGNSSAALTPSALCTLAWWAEAKKNKEFENALAQDGDSAVDTVSRIVNKGPGSKPGEKANNAAERQKAFKEVKACAK